MRQSWSGIRSYPSSFIVTRALEGYPDAVPVRWYVNVSEDQRSPTRRVRPFVPARATAVPTLRVQRSKVLV